MKRGRNAEALVGYQKLYKLAKINGINGRIHPNPMLKPAITMITGIDVGNTRGPLDPISDDERAELVKILKEIELI